MKLVKKSSTIKELDSVRCGERILDEFGKTGIVENIEVLKAKGEIYYYYKLKNNGTILVIV